MSTDIKDKRVTHLKVQRSTESSDSSGSKASKAFPPLIKKVTSQVREELVHVACLRNDPVLVEKVINFANYHDHQLDRSGTKYPSVVECSRRGYHQVLSILIRHGFDIESIDKTSGWTPLLTACFSGKKDVVDLLVSHGANCLVTNRRGETALHLAAKQEHSDVLDFLITRYGYKFNLDARDKDGRSVLHVLAANGLTDIVDLMIKAGAHVNLLDNMRRSPAHYAVTSGREDVLNLLLDQNIDLTQIDAQGRSLVYLATEGGRTSIVRLLLDYNGKTMSMDSKGRTPLHVAAKLGLKDIVSLLLTHGDTSIESADRKGNRPIHLATMAGEVETVFLLLSKGAYVDATNHRNQTPLHVASEAGHKEVVEILLAFSADMDAAEMGGITPLYIAARAGHTEIVDLLIHTDRQIKMDCVSDHVRRKKLMAAVSEDSNDDIVSAKDGPSSKVMDDIQEVIVLLSRHLLDPYDWFSLAKVWDFEDDQVSAIEYQWTGTNSYKDHSMRLMSIWLGSLPKDKCPFKELEASLVAIRKTRLASCLISRRTSSPNQFWLRHFRLLKMVTKCDDKSVCYKLCTIF